MTMSYLRYELQRLADEPHLLPEAPRASATNSAATCSSVRWR